MRADKEPQTAGTVETILRLRAVGVVDAAIEVLIRLQWRFQDQQLVKADAFAPVRPLRYEFGLEIHILLYGVDHHEVVAQRVQLAETHQFSH